MFLIWEKGLKVMQSFADHGAKLGVLGGGFFSLVLSLPVLGGAIIGGIIGLIAGIFWLKVWQSRLGRMAQSYKGRRVSYGHYQCSNGW